MSAREGRGYYRGIEIFQDDLKVEYIFQITIYIFKKFCVSNKTKIFTLIEGEKNK